MRLRYLNDRFHAGLPEPLEAGGGEFTTSRNRLGDDVHVLRGAGDYADAMDPVNWTFLDSTSRSSTVKAKVGGETLNLKVKKTRAQGDPDTWAFTEDFTPSSAPANILKAQLIYERLRYEDNELVIRAERPLGWVRTSQGMVWEVYALEQGLKPYSKYKGGPVADRLFNKYLTLKGDVGGFRFEDADTNLERDTLFGKQQDGRVLIVKVDNEYTQVIDIESLRGEAEDVEEMLSESGFGFGHYNGGVFGSYTGHPVAERLLSACTLMSDKQANEFLSPGVAGAFAKAMGEYAGKVAASKGGDSRDEFMMSFSTVLSNCRELVPEDRTRYIKGLTSLLGECDGDENRFRAGKRKLDDGARRLRAAAESTSDHTRPI